jgi:hypothetical protein
MVSKLTRIIESKHHEINLDDESRQRIYTWIDANVPYYGTWDMDRPHSVGGRDTFTPEFISAVGEIIKRRSLQGFSFQFGETDFMNGTFHKINLTHPENCRLLADNLAKSAGGYAADDKAAFQSKNDPDYLAIIAQTQKLGDALRAKPRMDMPGAIPIPQERNFGKVFP